jgi:hypothetical protein
MLWDIAIFALTVIGIRRKELPLRSQIWGVLVKQGMGYIFAAVLTSVPITVSLYSILNLEHYLMFIPGLISPTIESYV